MNFLERGGTGDLFATLRRGELEPEQAALLFSTEPGQVAAPVPSREGYELVRVLRFHPARLDEATREKVRKLLFEEWLAEGRRRARVEWFWGAAEAEESARRIPVNHFREALVASPAGEEWYARWRRESAPPPRLRFPPRWHRPDDRPPGPARP